MKKLIIIQADNGFWVKVPKTPNSPQIVYVFEKAQLMADFLSKYFGLTKAPPAPPEFKGRPALIERMNGK